jgi:uncharacterized lipoprotein YbaY
MLRLPRLAAVCGLGLLAALPAAAQEDQGGISTPLLSRCAGKFGAELRAGDEAFPGLTLLGKPWLTVEKTDRTVDGAHVVSILSGFGARSRRRGEVVAIRFRCLIDDKGAAVSFEDTELLPTRKEELPPAMVVRGSATYRPPTRLAPGSELRVQLVDQAASDAAQAGATPELLTEAVVRSSWVNPIPFGLRLPPEVKLEGRKLAIDARLSLGSATLFRLKAPQLLTHDRLQQPVDLTIDAVPGGAVR